MRRLLPVLVCILLVAAGCADSGSVTDSETTTTAVTTVAEFTPTTTKQPATASAVPALPQLAADLYEGVDASDVLLVEALVDAYNTGDGAAFIEAMGSTGEILYYDYSDKGAYDIRIEPNVQAQSIEEWDHPLGFRWELRRCEPSEDLPGSSQCAMYRYDPIADTEMHRFPVDAVLSVTTDDDSIQNIWLKYRGAVWTTLTWKFSRWVMIFHPEDWDTLFTTDPATRQLNYWDLNHSGESVEVLAERVAAWEEMTLLSQNKEFYDWVAANHPEALDVMWPSEWGLEHTFMADMAPFWTQLTDEYQS